MSDIKTGLMFSPLTERVYWGKMNTKTGIAYGNKKDITSDFIYTMLQKFPINTRQNITSNGETECVVIVLDEEKAKEYINAKEENAQLKSQLHDLFEHVSGVSVNEYKQEQMPYLADYIIGQAESDSMCIEKLKADKAELVDVIKQLDKHYCELVDSGDAGNWNPNDEEVIKLARKLLQKHKEPNNA